MSAATFDRISDRATTWLARAGCVALTIMMLITFCDVIGRQLFNAPLIFTVEVNQLLMGAMVYLAMGYTTFTRGHINVDLVVTRLSPRARAGMEVLTGIIGVVFVGLVSFYLFERAGLLFDKGDLTQLVRLPVWPVAGVMAIASLLMVTSLLLQLVQSVREFITNNPTDR